VRAATPGARAETPTIFLRGAPLEASAATTMRRRSVPTDQLELTLAPRPFVSGAFRRGEPTVEDLRRVRGPGLAPGEPALFGLTYAQYLRSDRWAELRAEAIERDGHACRFCNKPDDLSVHHRRYPARWGEETVQDLTTMCRGCHAVFGWFRRLHTERRRLGT